MLNLLIIIGIKHGFPCINVCQVPRELLKTEAEGPEGAVENRGRRPRFSTAPSGPGINVCQVPRELLKTEAEGPEGAVENRGRRPRFSTAPSGPGKR